MIDQAWIDKHVAQLVEFYADGFQVEDLRSVWDEVACIVFEVKAIADDPAARKRAEFELLKGFISNTDTFPGPAWVEATGDFIAIQFFKWVLGQ